MPSYEVKSGTSARLGRVEGDLKAGRNVTIKAESGVKVVVTGEATFEGQVTIECDFECGTMRVEGRGFGPGGNVTIRGNLTVHGSTNIDASARVDGTISSDDLDVGGHLESGPIDSKRVRAGGHMTVKGELRAETVDVGGHMKVLGEVSLTDLRVGGHAEFGGGSIRGEIRVRGHITSKKKLDFGRLEVFGSFSLPAGSSGQKLSALGTVRFEGDATCKELEVSGNAQVKGNLEADRVEVKGRLDVSGGLRASDRLRVYGTLDVGHSVECENLGVLGRLVGESVRVGGSAEVAGEVKTTTGLKAKSVLVGRGSKVTGPIVGEEVQVGRETDFGSMWGLPWWRSATGSVTTVGDVYGQSVRVYQRSSAKQVYGDVVELLDGAKAQQVTYTKGVKLPTKYSLREPPVKTARLPDPPL